jgi:hypothetical protein
MLAELPLLTFVIRNCFKPIREKHVLELKGEQRMSPNNVRHEPEQCSTFGLRKIFHLFAIDYSSLL